jgi:hypothetical protein
MQSRLIHIAAQQHIAELHRAADHRRLVHAATSGDDATGSHAVSAPRHAPASSVLFLRWLARKGHGRMGRSATT